MKTISVNVYQYSELSDKAKERARNWYLEGSDFEHEWDCLKEDVKNIGLNLTAWDYGRYCKGDFISSAPECAENILKEHGKTCETYKTAQVYLKSIKHLIDLCSDEMTTEQEEEKEDADNQFLNDILEDYRILADKQFEYCQSEEYIKEAMEANEYTFLQDGERF